MGTKEIFVIFLRGNKIISLCMGGNDPLERKIMMMYEKEE